jgi:hypothetical protein
MEETKLTVRIPRKLIERVKQYAALNHTTVTNLIEAYLQTIPSEGLLDDAPIVRRISGSLSPLVSVEDYHQHLEEKYRD